MSGQPGGPVDTVVFDLGNVLIGWDPAGAWRGLDPAAVAAFRAEGFTRWNHRMDAGLAPDDALAAIAADTPEHLPVATAYLDRFLDTLTGPVPGTRAVLTELADAGVRLLALTNWSGQLFELARPVLEEAVGLSAFEAVVVSGVERLAKPEPELFQRVLDRFGLVPQRTAFVDDAPVNVAAAAALGIRAVRFTGADRLRSQLAELGLSVHPHG